MNKKILFRKNTFNNNSGRTAHSRPDIKDQITYQTESYYDILVNDDNEILIVIKSRASEPEAPVIVYAGGKHAALLRNSGLTVILDYIHPEVRKLLRITDSALIAELSDGEIAREYTVEIRHEDALPVPDAVLP